MGTSSSKVPQYEVVDPRQASTSDNPRPSAGSFSPPSQGLLQSPSSNVQQWAPVQQTPPPPLPNGWDFHIDPATGYPYFYNTHTGVSQWQDPRGAGFALPERSDAIHLGERRQVIPPWEGGPADGDPLSWPLPPGWQEQVDQATNQRYFVNYDAHILSYNDPRVEIAKAYAQGPKVEGVPVHYPPPVIGRPVDEQPKPFQYGEHGPSPPVWPSAQGGPSYLPPPPTLKKKRKNSLWSKLGYRPGRGGGMYPSGGPLYLFDNPEVPGEDRSSSSSSSDDEDDKNERVDDVEVGDGVGLFILGQNFLDRDNSGATYSGGDDDDGGIEEDRIAVDEYGQPPDLFGGGVTGSSLGQGFGGGTASSGYQQPLFGSWLEQAKVVSFTGWDDGLNMSLKGRRLWMLDGYTKIIIVLTILVGAYFGIVEGFFSFLLGSGSRQVVLMCKRAKTVKGRKRRSSHKLRDTVRWVLRKRGSTLFQLKTIFNVAVSQLTYLQAWFYEHLYEHPVIKVQMLTERDEAGPLYSRLLPRPREITIVTQASADRLPAVEAMAKSWEGVMCVAIHVRTQKELQQVYPRLCSLHEQIEAQGLCRLNICVAKEEGLSTDKESMTALYPINAMRNMALSMATTDLVFILDADFVPSLRMHDMLTGDETTYSEILRMARTDCQMLVVPAFEAMGGKFDESDIMQITYPTRMAELTEQWKAGLAKAFHCSHFPRGHNPTNYELFFNPLTSKPYRVQYREFYEPYAICAREIIPPFDARFRGYGMNKISHAYHCATKGMGFSVLPQIFVWSLPHQKSEAWAFTFGRNKDPLQKLRILGLYRRFKTEIQLLQRSAKKTLKFSSTELLEIKVEGSFLPRHLQILV